MAGWDEEALLLASLIVEDTPVRESKHKKRSTSTTNSSRKRRAKRDKPYLMPAVVLCLDDEEEEVKKAIDVKKQEVENDVVDGEEKNKGIPCMDRLREELSCAICLEICFEPSTTPCGHSFCKKCLTCAATKCGKRCPKCRQLISNARSCTVNTVLWNTIQLLFPDEIETRRKNTASKNSRSSDIHNRSPEHESQRVRIRSTRSIPPSNSFVTAAQVSQAMERNSSSSSSNRSSRNIESRDALLALRLQREEFMEGISDDVREEPRLTVHSARANLRAMASRVYHIRTRGRY